MLTRHVRAYSSCSQTVSLSPAISSQFILRVCAAAEDRKNQQKPLNKLTNSSKYNLCIHCYC